MTGRGQSRKDPSALMKKKGSRYCSRIISSQIHHVDTDSSIMRPANFMKYSTNIGTWNVRSLESTSSKLLELSKSLTQYKMGIIGLTETHRPGCDEVLLDNGSLFINSGRNDGKRRQARILFSAIQSLKKYRQKSKLHRPKIIQSGSERGK